MKKRLYGILSVILAVILISGTLAFTPAIQRAFNPNLQEGQPEVVWARLHNDYNAYGYGPFNKDVYVENISDLQSIFVRVRIYEHLEFNGVSIVDGSEIENFSTWTLFQTELDDITQRAGDSLTIEENGVELVFGEVGNDKVFMPTFNRVHAPGVTATVPDVFELDYMHLTADASGRGFINHPYSPPAPHADWCPWYPRIQTSVGRDGEFGSNIGSHEYWRLGNTVEGTMYRFCYIAEDIVGEDRTHEARANEAATANVMTMENWFDDEPYDGDFWFFDVEEGWFYWSNLLAPRAATAPLLCEIIFAVNETIFEKEYISEIVMEFFTVDELDDVLNLSDEAREILEYVYIPSIIPEIGETFLDPETGQEWLVLDRREETALIIVSRRVFPLVTWQGGDGWRPMRDTGALLFADSTMRTAMNAWFANDENVGETLRGMALDYAFPEGSNGVEVEDAVLAAFGTPEGQFTIPANINLDRAISLPGSMSTRGNDSEDKVFPLSISEVNRYPAFREHLLTAIPATSGQEGLAGNMRTRSPNHLNAASSLGGIFVITRHHLNDEMLVQQRNLLTHNDSMRPAMWVTLY